MFFVMISILGSNDSINVTEIVAVWENILKALETWYIEKTELGFHFY